MNSAHEATNWLPGFLMLAAGAVVALAYLLGSKRLKTEAPNTGSVDDLNARYQAKLAQLKDHLASKHLGATDWAQMKTELEREATAILRERDGAKHEKVKAEARAEKKAAATAQARAPGGFFASNPQLKGAIIGGGVVGFFVLLGSGLNSNTADRREGGTMTGGAASANAPMQAPQEPPQDDPRLAPLVQRVQAAPEDADAVAELALYLVRRQAFDDARPLIDRVTMLDPFQTRGRVAREVMRAVEGDVSGAVVGLEHLATYYPDAYDARMFAGLIAADQNDPARAIRNLEAYLATAPPSEQPPFVRMQLQQLRAQLAPAP
jgi:hypothetical protein